MITRPEGFEDVSSMEVYLAWNECTGENSKTSTRAEEHVFGNGGCATCQDLLRSDISCPIAG